MSISCFRNSLIDHSQNSFSPIPHNSRDGEFLTHEEATIRYNKIYHGKITKAKIYENKNYYDHNILGLANRIQMNLKDNTGEIMYDSIISLKQSKSCNNVIYASNLDKRRNHRKGYEKSSHER